VAIARALLRDAPVLVLDEPTTGLDALSAGRLLEPLRELMRGRTALLVSHSMLLAADADRIAVLDGGRIVEHGHHDELLDAGELYARLWAEQHDREPIHG
jgi:ATP-binding cassette, subfamily B, bacterial